MSKLHDAEATLKALKYEKTADAAEQEARKLKVTQAEKFFQDQR